MTESLKCEECGVGRYRSIKSPYLMKMGQRMLVMPDAPAYLCDVCGHRCFDDDFLVSLYYLVRQAVDDPNRRSRRRQATPEVSAPAPLRQRR
jgi:hypothetical protein